MCIAREAKAIRLRPSFNPDPEILQQFLNHHLIIASVHGNLDDVMHLVALGADATHTDGSGCSALHHASLKGHVEVVKFFVEDLGMDVNMSLGEGAEDEYLDVKPIHLAAIYGQLPMIEYLISRGASPLDTCGDGLSVLHVAAWKGHVAVIKYLVEDQQVDAHLESPDKITALQLAKDQNQQPVVEYLQTKRKRKETRPSSNMVCLLIAILMSIYCYCSYQFVVSRYYEVGQYSNNGFKCASVMKNTVWNQSLEIVCEQATNIP